MVTVGQVQVYVVELCIECRLKSIYWKALPPKTKVGPA